MALTARNLFFLFFLSVAQEVAWAEDQEAGYRLPKLDIREVLQINDKFMIGSNIDLSGYKIVRIEYSRKQRVWDIYYRTDSLVIGENYMVIVISDRNPEEIEFYPGL